LGSFSVNIPTTPPPPSSVYLSDLTPTASVNGWGPYERDRSNGEQGATDGATLTINGTTYAKGLGVHAASSITYSLGGLYNRFQSYIGIDDEFTGGIGNVIFRVLADGVEIFQSGTVTGGSDPQFVDLDVTGRQTLQLIVDPNGINGSDHADWADAKLISGEVFRLSSNALNIISEGDGQAALLAVRNGANLAAASLQFTTNEIVGSATSGVDFTPPSTVTSNTGLINFATGQTEKTFAVTVTNDTAIEDNELFAVGIQNPSTGTLGAPRTARVLIVDDDGASRISLVESTLTVSEGDSFATLTLVRSGNRSAPATVQLVTSNGTATGGSDFGNVSTTVTFAANSFVQTVAIPILNDLIFEGSESFQVQISNPVDASLQGSTTATVTILDNDALGNAQRQSFASGFNSPTTFEWLPNGSTMLVAEKGGLVKVVENGVVRSTPLIDLSSIVNSTGDRGLLGLAVHPEFYSGSPYIYVLYTYDPPETSGQTGNAGPDGDGNRPSRLEKLTVNPATLAVTSREVILGKNSLWQYTSRPDVDSTGEVNVLPSGIVNGTTITATAANIDRGYQDNIPSLSGTQDQNIRDYLAGDSTSHSIGDLEFGPDGYLYVTNGDGTSYNFMDPRAVRVQDIANLSGKMLRIDPISGQGVATNPFFNGDANSNQSKVFYSGLRNAFRFSFDPVSGLPVIGDVGWNSWEEINIAAPGANFGWPYLEGPDQTGGYSTLGSAQSFYNNGNVNLNSPSRQPAVLPTLQLSHSSPDDFAAVMMGDFYNNNNFVYGDINSGRLFSATLNANGQVSAVSQFDSNAPFIVDVKLGPDGYLYGSSLFSAGFGPGEIVRWISGSPPPAVSPSITLAVAPASVLEDGTANLIYTFTRSGSTSSPLSVNYTVGGSATIGTDYTGISTTGTTKTVTFAAGSANAVVTVDPASDTTFENDETVALTLATGTGYTIGTTAAVTGTITNDDFALPSITLAVAPASVLENGTANLIYTFTRSGGTGSALTVNYTVGGTASIVTDYTGISTTGTTKTVTFAAGSANAVVTVDPTADLTIENDETVALTLATGTGYTIGTTAAVTGTITNDDGTPSISLSRSPASVLENGTTNIDYTFTRSVVTSSILIVNYTVGGSATIGTDYTGISTTGTTKTVTFEANSATAVVTVDPTADPTIENDETVALTLTAGSGYTIGTTGAVRATITNDDAITGTIGDNILDFTTNRDIITGAGGNDTFRLLNLTHSLLGSTNSPNYDRITDLGIGTPINDSIDSPSRTKPINPTVLGAVTALNATAIGTLLNSTNFAANGAATFTFGSSTFLALNDATAGYSATADAIIEITGYTGSLSALQII
ncbi:MAG: NPCBM/NEW2 domain-containing protein, partial [Prochlorococcaceae cyanobacterium]